MQRHRGFTLIELVTTVAILGILAGVGTPSMLTLVERQRASAAVGSLMAHAAQARMTAITQRHDAVLCPSADGRRCDPGHDWSGGWILFADEDGNRKPDSPDDILRVDQDPTSRHLRVVSTRGRQQLRYLPDGRSAGSNISVRLCREDTLLARVIVNNTGRIRSETASGSTPCHG